MSNATKDATKDATLKQFAMIFTNGKGKRVIPLYKLLSSGNRKLPITTAIFNMSSAHDCPSFKLGLCRAYNSKGKHICYARKAETSMFKCVEPRRNKQQDFWLNCTAEDFVSQILLINSMKANPWTALRLNESGDFHSQACVDKAERIALLLKRHGIIVYGYTSRSDLSFVNCKNLIVSGSSFKKEGIANIFLMVEDIKKQRPKGFGVCCGNCRVCNRCQVRGLNTVVKQH